MSDEQSRDFDEFLSVQQDRETLRFISCGSVDDGKSTLIGRLLFDSKAIFDDQLDALETESRQYGTQGETLDLALLVDGLQAEREQGITIDVAYRFFDTGMRHFVVADTPGHEQYTRNMATAASSADLAIILIDARKGILQQTRRHTRIVAMMGVKHVVLAVNKMDLVNYDEKILTQIESQYRKICADYNYHSLQTIPLSALTGENVSELSRAMPWYNGPTLLEYLNSVDVTELESELAFRMPVQWVNRPNSEFRGFSGTIASGAISVGDSVRVLPSGVKTKIKSIIGGFNELKTAVHGESVCLSLSEEVDVSRGDMLVAADQPPEVADQFEARLLWMSATVMTPGRQYVLKLASKEVMVTITEIKYREDVNTGAHLAAKILELNEIATVNLSCNSPIAFEPYTVNRTLGSFILIDKLTCQTVGAGMIDFALRRASNIHWQALELNKAARANQKFQTPSCVWFTGLSGSGKSTIGNMLEKRLHAEGKHTYLLDGDNVRHGLNRDLGFTEADRVENIRRVAEVAKLMADAGLIVLVSFISPFRAERRMARDMFDEGEFIEVFVDTPIEECERRDVKGLYAKARKGELKNFTGIDSPYEAPETPEIHVHTDQLDLDGCVEEIVRLLK